LSCTRTGHWLRFEFDAVSQSPIILFPYPRVGPPGAYIAPLVKMEFGSLTDQRPIGTHTITPLVAGLARLAPNKWLNGRADRD